MTKTSFIKILTIGFALATMRYPNVWAATCSDNQLQDPTTGHCLDTGSDCSGNCTWYKDTTTKEVWIKKNPGATAENIVVGGSYNYATSLTIGEGITEIGTKGNTICSRCTGKLTLPTSLRNVNWQSMLWNEFSTVEVKGTNFSMADSSFSTYRGNDQTFIITADENFTFRSAAFNSNGNINIQCKGKISVCKNMFSAVKSAKENKGYTVSALHYVAEEDGNWVKYTDTNKEIYDISDKTKLLATYDFDGHQIARYQYDAGGNLIAVYENGVATYRRRIYTPSEATAVAKGNKNTFSITYR